MPESPTSQATVATQTDYSAAPVRSEGVLASGQMLGTYLIKKLLGTGGMGEVYLAEQQSPVVREVALKLIAQKRSSEREKLHFEIESRVLARMQHPAIAQVFDVAATPSGSPYFAMEYVSGESITRYCDHAQLSPRQRIELFVRVCKGVHHAHQKGVVHRDLKPANILVAPIDGVPQPKIIDFGIATGMSTTKSASRSLAGTPDYMSPEQAGLTAEDVDIRSDVFSLGIVLFEMLTGARPFAQSAGLSSDQARHSPSEAKPSFTLRKPVELLNSLQTSELNAVAAARRLDPAALRKQFRGDLSWVMLKAVQPKRADRYDSALAFAEDLERVLGHFPARAAPASKWRNLLCWIRRHRLAFALSTVTLLAICAGLGGALYGLQQARIERDAAMSARSYAETQRLRAEQQARISAAVSSFLTEDLFGSADINQREDGAKITVREVVDKAASSLSKTLAGEPEVEAAVQEALGQALKSLGDSQAALLQFERAYATQVRLHGADSEAALGVFQNIGSLKLRLSDYADSERIYRDGLKRSEARLGFDHKISLDFAGGLAILLWQVQQVPEGIKLSERVLASPALKNPEWGAERRSITVNNLGRLYRLANRFEEAEKAHLDAIAYRRRNYGENAFTTLEAVNDLAGLYRAMSRLDESERMYRQAIVGYRSVYGDDHPATGTALNNLAKVLSNQSRDAEAVALYDEALGIATRKYGPDDYLTGAVINNRAMSYTALKRYSEAERDFQRAEKILSGKLPPHHRQVIGMYTAMGTLYRAWNKPELAKAAEAKAAAGNATIPR